MHLHNMPIVRTHPMINAVSLIETVTHLIRLFTSKIAVLKINFSLTLNYLNSNNKLHIVLALPWNSVHKEHTSRAAVHSIQCTMNLCVCVGLVCLSAVENFLRLSSVCLQPIGNLLSYSVLLLLLFLVCVAQLMYSSCDSWSLCLPKLNANRRD